MGRKRKAKTSYPAGQFFTVPHALLDDPRYLGLSAQARALLFDLMRQFNGGNNGLLTACWKQMRDRGWKSASTVYRAIVELMDAGLVEQTRQGDKNKASFFALAWLELDPCHNRRGHPKHDATPTSTPRIKFSRPKN